jgi:hypothetical protein
MADEMDRMFDEFRLGQRWTTPPLRETRAEGWAAEIAVFQKNSELSIRANLYRSERSYGSFGRVIPLADGAIMGKPMRTLILTFPEIVFIAATRGALGVGIGLLVSDKMSKPRRKAVGWSLFSLGAVTTIPAARRLLARRADAPVKPYAISA